MASRGHRNAVGFDPVTVVEMKSVFAETLPCSNPSSVSNPTNVRVKNGLFVVCFKPAQVKSPSIPSTQLEADIGPSSPVCRAPGGRGKALGLIARPGPTDGASGGVADSLDEAKAAFWAAWERRP